MSAASLPDDIDALKALVLAGRAEVEHLKLIIAKLKRLQFGRRSEKLDREIEQLELRLEELQVTAAAAPSTSHKSPRRGDAQRVCIKTQLRERNTAL